jgi:hypothetical protein
VNLRRDHHRQAAVCPDCGTVFQGIRMEDAGGHVSPAQEAKIVQDGETFVLLAKLLARTNDN